MEQSTLSFEQILTATVRMVRTSWSAAVCLFLQIDDTGTLQVRAADGISPEAWKGVHFPLSHPLIKKCMQEDRVFQGALADPKDPLRDLLKAATGQTPEYVFVPVSGQSKVFGLLILGPFASAAEAVAREAELRGSAALCAVLSAHWRLYEWMAHFLPEVNHELRTPLTAVQGSISMVLGGMFGQVGGEVREMLEMAQKGCERTVRAIEDYLNNQKLPQK